MDEPRHPINNIQQVQGNAPHPLHPHPHPPRSTVQLPPTSQLAQQHEEQCLHATQYIQQACQSLLHRTPMLHTAHCATGPYASRDYTHFIGFIHCGTMSQQNRKAFMVSIICSNHESRLAPLIKTGIIITTDPMQNQQYQDRV